MPELADELKAHFPSQLVPVFRDWELVHPDKDMPNRPQPNITALQTMWKESFPALNVVVTTERLDGHCRRWWYWIWLCRLLRST